jgi:multiple sugar transport system ATP-binding protein
VVGPSGSGKTTLLRLVAGLETPDAGRLFLDEREVTHQPAGQRNVAMVFQSLALYPHMTAAQNITLGLRLRKLPRTEREERLEGIAAQLRIQDQLGRRPNELSAGQRQRVALARALIRRPDVLLLDEPLSHLDTPLRRELCRELQRLHQDFRLTTLLVTHDLPTAEALGQRLAVMNEGRFEQVGSVEQLRSQPATQFVSDFLNPNLL